MPDIVLATLNARWAHSAFGLRYLLANLGELRQRALIREFTIQQDPLAVVDELIALEPRILGLGVYIWNAELSAKVVSLLKRLRPDITVVLGGPEVSYEWEEQAVAAEADYLITGEGDLAFAELCRSLLDGERPDSKVLHGGAPPFDDLALPYEEYDDEDIRQRVLYVEASRGCPFRCEFCLSSLDKGVRKAELTGFLAAMDRLLERGARRFKFVDRTFNLDVRTSAAILEFFLERLRPDLFLHFELIPDRLPEALRDPIARFPEGTLQFEVGIQSFDPDVNARILRKQDNETAEDNLRWLAEHTGVHLHTDLIVGLPGESMEGFGRGFDRLLGLGPQEIQVGILKRLRGTSLNRHNDEHGMVYSADPPYEILQTAAIPFSAMQRLKRFARYWDMTVNSGNFVRSAPLLWHDGSPFERFLELSDFLYRRFERSWSIALPKLAEALFDHLTQDHALPPEEVGALLWLDYSQGGRRKSIPGFLQGFASGTAEEEPEAIEAAGARQARHRAGRAG